MSKRVVVVEDEANILLSLVFILEREGYRVRSATSGAAGLAELRRERPDLVILDLMLPDVSGYEVCRQARLDPALATLPILVLTARAQEAERRKGIELGATEYVTKPFRVADLLDRVASLLARADPASGAGQGSGREAGAEAPDRG